MSEGTVYAGIVGDLQKDHSGKRRGCPLEQVCHRQPKEGPLSETTK